MIKLVAGVRAKDGVGREELRQHWCDVHAPNVVAGVNPKRYVLTFFDERLDGGPAPYDGTASLWFDSLEQYQEAQLPHPHAAADGFGDLLVPDDTFVLFTTEIVALDGEVTSESVKATFFVQRLADVAEADYFQHWREKHLPNVRAALQRNPGGLRYVVSQADQGQPGPWSGLAELYWQDADAERSGLPGVTDDGFRGMSEPYFGIRGREVVIVG
jgi:hypothetical protein